MNINNDQVRGQISEQIYKPLYDCIAMQVSEQVRNCLFNQMRIQMAQIYVTCFQISNQVKDQVKKIV